jgi:uncharacterized metal-binding protein
MIRHSSYRDLRLVDACSGCSSAAQAADHVALSLDRAGIAEMSCIAGVGGDVAPLVEVACSGRPIIARDGCALNCARHCLAQRGLAPDVHPELQARGVKKRYHADFDREQADPIAGEVGVLAREVVKQAAAGSDSPRLPAVAAGGQKCGLSGRAS